MATYSRTFACIRRQKQADYRARKTASRKDIMSQQRERSGYLSPQECAGHTCHYVTITYDRDGERTILCTAPAIYRTIGANLWYCKEHAPEVATEDERIYLEQ